MKWLAGVVLHDVYLLLAHHVAAEIFLEVHPALQSHAKIARLIISAEKFFWRLQFVHVFPPATIKGL